MSESSVHKTFKKVDLIVLLSSLLIFSMGIGLLHGDGERDDTPEQIFTDYLAPYIQSGSPSQVAKAIIAFPYKKTDFPSTFIQVAQMVVEQSSLSTWDKIRFIFKITNRSDKSLHNKLFDALLLQTTTATTLLKNPSFLYIAVTGKQRDVIPDFLKWLQDTTTKDPKIKNLADKIKHDALEYAVKMDNLDNLQKLVEKGLALDKTLATNLLLLAVQKNKNADFVTYLKTKGADLNAEYPQRKGYTPLIKAVDNQNMDVIKALISAGADVNLIRDPSVGSPLQHAVALRNTEIDAYLRENKARE